jgi:rSAM/selenodomain-associated transferase 2
MASPEARRMISVILPTLNAEASLGDTLTALIPAAVEGVVREVIIVDGGSTDHTLRIADAAGATIIRAAPGRGVQLATGAAVAKGAWLLFLHADTILEPGWSRDAGLLMERVDRGKLQPTAAAFRFALDDLGWKPRVVEAGVGFRSSILKLPYGDQGLLISRSLYDEIGGYRPLPMMEDVDIVRRLGFRRIVTLRTSAVTSAARYQRDGYLVRVARNLTCLLLYSLGVPVRVITRLYG